MLLSVVFGPTEPPTAMQVVKMLCLHLHSRSPSASSKDLSIFTPYGVRCCKALLAAVLQQLRGGFYLPACGCQLQLVWEKGLVPPLKEGAGRNICALVWPVSVPEVRLHCLVLNKSSRVSLRRVQDTAELLEAGIGTASAKCGHAGPLLATPRESFRLLDQEQDIHVLI